MGKNEIPDTEKEPLVVEVEIAFIGIFICMENMSFSGKTQMYRR